MLTTFSCLFLFVDIFCPAPPPQHHQYLVLPSERGKAKATLKFYPLSRPRYEIAKIYQFDTASAHLPHTRVAGVECGKKIKKERKNKNKSRPGPEPEAKIASGNRSKAKQSQHKRPGHLMGRGCGRWIVLEQWNQCSFSRVPRSRGPPTTPPPPPAREGNYVLMLLIFLRPRSFATAAQNHMGPGTAARVPAYLLVNRQKHTHTHTLRETVRVTRGRIFMVRTLRDCR